MESPQLAWEFMKKLANSPWAPVIRLLGDPEVVGLAPKLDLVEDLEDCAVVAEDTAPSNLKDDLEDCAVVVEETDCPAQKPTTLPGESSEDSDSLPRYCPSVPDSDDSFVVVDEDDEVQPNKLPVIVPTQGERLQTPCSRSAKKKKKKKKNKHAPKSKKKSSASSQKCRASASPGGQVSERNDTCDETGGQASERNDTCDAAVHGGRASTKTFEYRGQFLALKTLKIVLLDLDKVGSCISSVLRDSDELDKNGRVRKSKKKSTPLVISSDESVDENSRSTASRSDANLKRPHNFSWGLDSIQELEKRRKLSKKPGKNCDSGEEKELLTPCTTEVSAASGKSAENSNSSSQSVSKPDDCFGLNAWRLGLVTQELSRLHELAERVQASRLSLETRKQVAYKLKYGLNEVARLVTKKSLNSIVEKHEELEMLEEVKARFLDSDSPEKEPAAPSRMQLSLVDRGSSTSKEAEGTVRSLSKEVTVPGPGRPVVDVHMPTLMQGVAAGFLSIFERLERLESQCSDNEKTVSEPKETSKSIDLTELD